jgi:hypothetical protein
MKAGKLDAAVSNVPISMWLAILNQSQFSISIGCAAAATPGINHSYLLIPYYGATPLVFPHGTAFEPELPVAHSFRDGAELLRLCEAAGQGDLDTTLPATRDFIDAHHSHYVRAAQLLRLLAESC